MANDHSSEELEPRQPTVEDRRDWCHELNKRGAKFVVVGGFAMRAANFFRETMDIDLVVATDMENEANFFSALSTLPDNAVRELQPGELQKHTVIRVGDEIVVDLMGLASGIDYAEALKDIIIRDVDGVPIPFASPRLLWRMKAKALWEKDANDVRFFKHWFAERGETPPPV
ncbi:MAG TPA: hypothetical protein VME24_07670 [Alphaproteobacteria bacterium]|nr:hypothetical protein [Alphaproteobacteria bacterium]